MTVLRIVADLTAEAPAERAVFYEQVFGLKTVMDGGFIVTLANDMKAPVQVSLASEGGSGTPVPMLSIEVDDLDDTLSRAKAVGAEPEYGPVDEPWGVRRFFIRDPGGVLLNVLMHKES